MSPWTRLGLRLGSDVCQALRAEAVAGLKALPKRGAEVGGILTRRAGAGATSMIDGFELIPCEHLYGPSYRLSPLDKENFRARCGELQAGDAVRVAGLFRSSTRETFQVTAEDVAFVRELLSDTAVIVLIKPFLTGSAIFRVFPPTKEREWREFEEFEVGNELFAPATVFAAAAAPAAAKESSLRQPPSADAGKGQSVRSQLPRRRVANRWTILFRAFCALALVAVLLVVARGVWKGAPRTRSTPDLGMEVVSQGDTLRLTWNRSLSSVRDSIGGNLQIHDGEKYREVALDRTEVARGLIYYIPTSDDVTFRLNIQSHEPTQLSGIARILAGHKVEDSLAASERPAAISPPVPKAQNAISGAVPHRLRTSAIPEPARSTLPPRPLPSKAQPDRAVTASNVFNNVSAPSSETVRPSVITNAEKNDAQKPAETAPREAAAPNTHGSLSLPGQNMPAVPVPSGADRSPQTGRTGEQPDTPRSRSAATAPIDSPVPARPIKKVMPVRPSFGAPAILSPMTVTLAVTIDRHGNVVEAHALRSPSQYWSSRAIEAAKQWQFEPAMLHDQSVSSAATIDFRFSPRQETH